MWKGVFLTGGTRIYRAQQTSEPDATRPKGDFLQSPIGDVQSKRHLNLEYVYKYEKINLRKGKNEKV